MTKIDHFVSERQSAILAQLRQNGRVLAQELAQDFGVSEDTIRRDLREMAARGECQRVYGGALLTPGTTVPFKTRLAEMPDRKATLGQTAASLVENGMTVFLDAGSTNLAIARHLLPHKLTVVTNTPAIAAELTGQEGIELIMIGGRIDPAVGASFDTTAIRQLEQIRPDLCIIGVCGLAMERGLCADIYEDSVFKQLACNTSARTMAAITTEKLGAGAPFHVRTLSSTLTLVLESDADNEIVEALKDSGAIVHRAPPPSPTRNT